MTKSVIGRRGTNFVEKGAIIVERDEKEIMISVLGGRTTMTQDDVVTETTMTIVGTGREGGTHHLMVAEIGARHR